MFLLLETLVTLIWSKVRIKTVSPAVDLLIQNNPGTILTAGKKTNQVFSSWKFGYFFLKMTPKLEKHVNSVDLPIKKKWPRHHLNSRKYLNNVCFLESLMTSYKFTPKLGKKTLSLTCRSKMTQTSFKQEVNKKKHTKKTKQCLFIFNLKVFRFFLNDPKVGKSLLTLLTYRLKVTQAPFFTAENT